MTDKIVIEGIDGYDGEYEIEPDAFTNGDFRTIKRISGVRAGEMQDSMLAGDIDLVVALAVVALKRVGKPIIEDVLWNASLGTIRYVGEKKEQVPPTPGVPETPPETLSEDGEKSSSSSESSAASSERLATTL